MLREWNEWENVSVDTPVWVRDKEYSAWIPLHFAKYKDGKVFTFVGGRTSHSDPCSEARSMLCSWNFATVEPPEEETNWKEIPVDTPIWVRNSPKEEWVLRYFHSIDYTGAVFAWLDGKKSRDLKNKLVQKVRWNLAKIAL